MPVPPGIFAIWDGMGLVAKRVEHEPNSDPAMVVIKSVNPEYQTYERMADEVHIVGRVVWTSQCGQLDCVQVNRRPACDNG